MYETRSKPCTLYVVLPVPLDKIPRQGTFPLLTDLCTFLSQNRRVEHEWKVITTATRRHPCLL